MSCKIAEELTIKAVLAPQAQAKGGNATGAYIACPPGLGSIDFVVRHGALAEGKSVTVEVYQATDVSKGFVTVKVSNDSAVDAVPVDAFALIRKQNCK